MGVDLSGLYFLPLALLLQCVCAFRLMTFIAQPSSSLASRLVFHRLVSKVRRKEPFLTLPSVKSSLRLVLQTRFLIIIISKEKDQKKNAVSIGMFHVF